MLNKWFINSLFVHTLNTTYIEVRTCERYGTLKHVLWSVKTQSYKYIEKILREKK